MKNLFLRLLPFLLSLLVGIVIFIIAEFHVNHVGFTSLVIGVASGLLSIPIIFICYEFVNNFTKKKINRAILEHVIYEVNDSIIMIILCLKRLINFEEKITKDNIAYFLVELKSKDPLEMSLDASIPKMLEKHKAVLLDLMYKGNAFNIIPNAQVENILNLTKLLGVISREVESAKNNKILKTSISALVDRIENWVLYCEEDAILNHHSFSIYI